MINRLIDYAPADYQKRVYFEPFLGAGSMFFALRPKMARLGDANVHLIDCYTAVRDSPSEVARHLRFHKSAHSEDHYYRVRDIYNRSRASAAQAARFVYLNKTCFNGVFRVNRQGKFNVPFGLKPNPDLPTVKVLRSVASALSHAYLTAADYVATLHHARSGDFIYLDPPYPPLNGTAFFTHYTIDRFGADDQMRLAALVKDLDRRGCLVMMSNADVPMVRELYRGMHMASIPVTRYVTCKRKKHRVNEVVITNYDPAR